MRRAIARGESAAPEGVDAYPDLAPGLELYWRAFRDLHSDRNGLTGMIEWSAMRAWAEANDLGAEEFSDLVYLMQAMDAELDRWRRAREKKE